MAFYTSARNQIRSDIKSQTRIQTCYPLLTPTPQMLHSVTPSVAFVSIRSTKSLFTVFRPFLNAAIYAQTHSNCTDRNAHTNQTHHHSKLHTKCLQSGRRRFKMADSWTCVCMCGNRAECFVLTEKLAASQ